MEAWSQGHSSHSGALFVCHAEPLRSSHPKPRAAADLLTAECHVVAIVDTVWPVHVVTWTALALPPNNMRWYFLCVFSSRLAVPQLVDLVADLGPSPLLPVSPGFK